MPSEAKEKTIKQAGISIKKPSSNQKSTITKVVNKMNEMKNKSAERNNTNKTDHTNMILGEHIDQTNKTKNGKTEVKNIEMPQDKSNIMSEKGESFSMSPLASPPTTVINNKELILNYEKTSEKHNASMKSAVLQDQNAILDEQNEYFESLANELENDQNNQFLTKMSDIKETRDLSSPQNDFKLTKHIDEMTSCELKDGQANRENLKSNKSTTNIYQNKYNSMNQTKSHFTSPIHNDLNNEELKGPKQTSSIEQKEKFDTNNEIDWESITQWNPSLVAMSQKYLSKSESQPIHSNATISQEKPISQNHKQNRQLEEVSPTTDVQSMTQVYT